MQNLVNTWFATLDYIKANQEKAYEVMAKRAGVTVDEYKQYASGTKIFSLEDNLKAFNPGNNITSLPYAAKEISTFLVEANLAKQTLSLVNYLTIALSKHTLQNKISS